MAVANDNSRGDGGGRTIGSDCGRGALSSGGSGGACWWWVVSA